MVHDFGKFCSVTVFVQFCISTTCINPCFSLGKYIQYSVAAFVKSSFYLISDNSRKQVDDRDLTSAKERTSGGKRSTPKKDGRYSDTWSGGSIFEDETLDSKFSQFKACQQTTNCWLFISKLKTERITVDPFCHIVVN